MSEQTSTAPELRGNASKTNQAPTDSDKIALLSPEEVQKQTRSQMQVAATAIADPLTSPLAQMVHDQLAYNVIQKLPAIMGAAGGTLHDFMSGALSSDNLMGANPMAPYLKMAGIEE